MNKKNTSNKSWYVFETKWGFFTSLKKLTEEEAEDCLNRGRFFTDFPEFGIYGGINFVSGYYFYPDWTRKQAEEFANQTEAKRKQGEKSPVEILADGEVDSLYGM